MSVWLKIIAVKNYGFLIKICTATIWSTGQGDEGFYDQNFQALTINFILKLLDIVLIFADKLYILLRTKIIRCNCGHSGRPEV
jgi:hypothetical protein